MAFHANINAVDKYYQKFRKTSQSSSSETFSSSENENEEESDERLINKEITRRNDVTAPNELVDKNLQDREISVKNSTGVHVGDNFIFLVNDPEKIDGVNLRNRVPPNWADIEKKLSKATEKRKYEKESFFNRQRIFIATAAFLILSIIGTALYFVIKELTKAQPIEIITRKQWNASDPPLEIIFDELKLPVKTYILYNTVTPECFNVKDCSDNVLAIQIYHLSRGYDFDDIAYNFLIGGDGSIYEGRGWKIQGAHTSGYNRYTLAVAFIGNFERKLPTDKQIKAGLALFDEGVRVGAVTPDYKIFGALQLRETQSPGEKFYNEVVKKWKHWGDPFDDLD